MTSTPYDHAFYATQQEGSHSSARAIAPLVIDLLRPRSVLDVGCGVGTWLAAFHEHGIDDIQGIDGPHVDRAMLRIPADRFAAHNLEAPLHLGRTFDLAVSLEVAEHLRPASAQTFVDSLARHAPAVLFSAAIPFQGGVEHVNEQWPAYWAERFQARGYLPIDAIRRRVWTDERVDWWYAQNTLLYASRDLIAARPELQAALDTHGPGAPALVHPKRYLAEADPAQRTVRADLARLQRTFTLAALRRVRQRFP